MGISIMMDRKYQLVCVRCGGLVELGELAEHDREHPVRGGLYREVMQRVEPLDHPRVRSLQKVLERAEGRSA
jgi:hypothetical protein